MRTTVTRGADQITALRIGNALYRTKGDDSLLLSTAILQTQILHPISEEVYQPAVPLALVHKDAGALKLDCIVPTVVKPTNNVVSLGRPFSFCFMRDTTKLLVTFGSAGLDVLRPRLGTFKSHEIPMQVEVVSDKTKIAEAKTLSLSMETADPALFQITSEMTPLTGPVDCKQAELRILQLSGNPPVYPDEAKSRHLSGTVVLDAVIGIDGHVHSVQSAGSANPLLVQAAKDAVSRWLYRPFEIGGVPFEVKTQITLHFAISW